MILIVNDYTSLKGGAGEIAESEYLLLKQEKEVKLLIAVKNKRNFVRIFLLNILCLTYSLIAKKIIVHTWSYFPVVSLISKWRNVYFVVHDYLTVCPSKSLYDFQENKPCSIKGYSSACLSKNCGYSITRKRYSKVTRPRLKTVRLLSDIKQELFVEAKYISILPNVDTFPSLRKNQPKSIDCIFIGRYTLDKGFDRFLSLAGNNETMKFVSLGNGPISVIGNVENEGWINKKEEILSFLSKSRLLIYPSRQIDADPIIVRQALKLKIPVLIDSNNALAKLVEEMCGVNFVIRDWNNVDLSELVKLEWDFQKSTFPDIKDLMNLYGV
jgi:glycosyltransferase involved in cell wall biosynthesis